MPPLDPVHATELVRYRQALDAAQRHTEELEDRLRRIEHSRAYQLLLRYQNLPFRPSSFLAPVRKLVNRFRRRPSTQPVSTPPPAPTVDFKSALFGQYRSLLADHLHSGRTINLSTATDPLVSVLLVVHNRAELTLQCLMSLQQIRVPFEVVVVDNASGDDTARLLRTVPAVRVIHNDANEHFLVGCNQAAAAAVGKHLLLLNNDAQLQPGAVEAALENLTQSDTVGAVGGRVILLDGTLQEAGSMVWADGSCSGYGRGDDPAAGPYQFRRDVDYCSGVFLLTPRELFQRLGGFDEAYKPAYYEEVDYCLRLQDAGYRVVYEPRSVVLHCEFGSATGSEQAIALQSRNRVTFVNRHADRLAKQPPFAAAAVYRARFAGADRPAILVIDDYVPHVTMGRGYPRANALLRALVEDNYRVTFYPNILVPIWEDWHEVYRDLPRELEVIVKRGHAGLEAFLAERRGYYSTVVVSRPHNMEVFRVVRSAHPDWFDGVRVVYDAEAVFGTRDVLRRAVFNDPMPSDEADHLIQSEVELASASDCVLTVSPREGRYFGERALVAAHPVTAVPTAATFAQRRGLLFVGSVHAGPVPIPNEDAVLQLLEEILPRLGDVPLSLAGEIESPAVLAALRPGVTAMGPVADLTPLYDAARVFVAPTRFSAGIPLKVIDAAGHGLPVVATPLLAEQLGWRDGEEMLVAEGPNAFAAAVRRLYDDGVLWSALRRRALERVRREYSAERFRAAVRAAVRAAA